MSLPGFLQDYDRTPAIQPAATPSPWCEDAYVACLENCWSWPDAGVCECYCDNALCRCTNPGCPLQRCE